MGIFLRLAASAAAVWVATVLLDGIRVTAETTLGKIGTYVAVAVLFGVVNAVLRPIIKTLGCSFYVFTLGLIALVVNGALLLLTSAIAGLLDLPFKVDNFWPSAVLGALIIGVTSWLLNIFIRNRPFRGGRDSAPPSRRSDQRYYPEPPRYPQVPQRPQYPDSQQYPQSGGGQYGQQYPQGGQHGQQGQYPQGPQYGQPQPPRRYEDEGDWR